ncbi:MAG: hypothetical protein HOJ90_08250 [Alphaproteobacteria bacterium]|nr:hypothetical protein [Alphaproteobacteria bacterium]
MNAQKFQLRYSQVEDRILIIVTDEHDQEEVFGLTRRLVRRLVPGLETVLRKAGHLVQPQVPDTTGPAPAPTPSEVAAFRARDNEKAESAPQSAPGTAAGESQQPPPAPIPILSHLVTRLRVVDQGKGRHILQITDGLKSINIPLTDEQLAQFSHGVVTVLKNADWNLPAASASDPDDNMTSETADAAIDITAESPSKYRH